MIVLSLFAQKPIPNVDKSLGKQALSCTSEKLNSVTITGDHLANIIGFCSLLLANIVLQAYYFL